MIDVDLYLITNYNILQLVVIFDHYIKLWQNKLRFYKRLLILGKISKVWF